MGRYERFGDAQGAASLVSTTGRILLVRIKGCISQPLAGHIGHRLDELVSGLRGGQVFLDASAVERWHSLAFATILGATLATRQRTSSFVVRFPSAIALDVCKTSAMKLELMESREAFEAKLRVAAGSDYLSYAELDDGEPRSPSRKAFVYVFTSSNFERGWLSAQRSEALSRRPRGSWACVAQDDDGALRLARRAALVEWPRPATRSKLAFTVRFVEASRSPESSTDRPREVVYMNRLV